MTNGSDLVVRASFNQGAEKVVKIWSSETGEFLRNLSGHTQGLSDIAWSSDNVHLASASDDTTIRIWDVELVCRCTQQDLLKLCF